MKTWTTRKIRQAKGVHKLACLTAYDFTSAKLMDEAGVPLILVGDSLAMAVLGYDSTLPATMEQMLHHTMAVVRGTSRALVVADMPFMSYQVSTEQALTNAGRFLKEAGADAVKVEGGALRAPLISALVANGIPVLGHIGLTPQSVHAFGGYHVQGRSEAEAEQLRADAVALSMAGVFAIVLECIPAELASEITATFPVPTIGIGAGPGCDGQVLDMHDMLGLFDSFKPRFVKQYAQVGQTMRQAFLDYVREVADGVFPAEDHAYGGATKG
jgi:3-methyl-2-oxobutanoate hydroxymethyltransferase